MSFPMKAEMGDPRSFFERFFLHALFVVSSFALALLLVFRGPMIQRTSADGIPTSQNRLTYSQGAFNTQWTKTAVTVADGTSDTADPFGGSNATKITDIAGTSFHRVYRAATVPSATVFTQSIYAKKGTKSWIAIEYNDAEATFAYFNLDNGQSSASPGLQANAQYVGNGWYRCSVTGSSIVANPNNSFNMSDPNMASYTADGTGTMYVFGAQVTQADWPGPYVQTTSSPVDTGEIRDVPTNVSAALNQSGQALLSWTSPAYNGGSAITSYTVRYGLQSGDSACDPTVSPYTNCSLTTGITPNSSDPQGITISSLTASGTYMFAVYAVNDLGESGPSYGTAGVQIPMTQNVMTYSEGNFDSHWIKTGVTVVDGTSDTLDPFGGSNATKLSETSGYDYHRVYSSTNIAANATFTRSIYAKAGTRSWLAIEINDSSGTFAWFDLINGRIGTVNPNVKAHIESVGNGWFRCSVTGTFTDAQQNDAFNMETADGEVLYTSDGTGTMYLYGAQVTQANWAGPYVMTGAGVVNTGLIRDIVTDLSGTSGVGGEVPLTWSTPAYNGGVMTTSYTVRYGASSNCDPTTPPYTNCLSKTGIVPNESDPQTTTITSLAGGVEDIFSVFAMNTFGESAASYTATSTPSTIILAPTISSLSPSSIFEGNGSFVLTVNGSNFYPNSVVRWNGVDLSSTYVTTTQLTGVVTETDVATSGTASVTVFTPSPGGGESSSVPFTISSVSQVEVLSAIPSGSSGGEQSALFLLTAGTNTNLYVHGTATSHSGCQFLSSVTAKVYLSDQAADCTPNGYSCVAASSTAFTACSSGTGGLTANYEVAVPMPYYADPTDTGSPDASKHWLATVTVKNNTNNTASINSDPFDIASLTAIDFSANVNYSLLPFGQISNPQTITFYNKGNRAVNASVIANGPMNCQTGSIPASAVHISASSNDSFAQMTPLSSSSTVPLALGLARRTTGADPSVQLFTRLQMPEKGLAGACANTLLFTAIPQ